MGGYSLQKRRSKHHQHVSKPFCEKNAINKTFRVTRTLPSFPDKPIAEALIMESVFRKTANHSRRAESHSLGSSHLHTEAQDRVGQAPMDKDCPNSKARTRFRPSVVAKDSPSPLGVLSPEHRRQLLPDSRASVDKAGTDSRQYSAPHKARPTSDKEPNTDDMEIAIHRKDALQHPTAAHDGSYPQTDRSSMNYGCG